LPAGIITGFRAGSSLGVGWEELAMKCFVCGEEMRLTLVEPHDQVTMRGFEYRTFQCESCGDKERRFVFDPGTSLDLSSIGTS